MQRDIEKYTQDYLSADYEFEKTMVRIRREKILGFLESHRAKRILEIGCGESCIANHTRDFEQLVIVEPSEVFVKIAREDCKGLVNVKIINDFLENQIQVLKHHSFDFIILSSLLHEVREPKEFLKSVFELCSTETILHINVPNALSFHLLWAYKSGLLNLGDLTPSAKKLQQHSAFTQESLVEFISSARGGGIKMIEQGSYFLKPFNHAKMSLLLKEGVINEELLRGLEGMIEFCPRFGAEIFVNCKIES